MHWKMVWNSIWCCYIQFSKQIWSDFQLYLEDKSETDEKRAGNWTCVRKWSLTVFHLQEWIIIVTKKVYTGSKEFFRAVTELFWLLLSEVAKKTETKIKRYAIRSAQKFVRHYNWRGLMLIWWEIIAICCISDFFLAIFSSHFYVSHRKLTLNKDGKNDIRALSKMNFVADLFQDYIALVDICGPDSDF